MKTRHNTNIDTKFNLVAWLNITDDNVSIEDAVKLAEEAGNRVIEIDREGRRLKALDSEMYVEETYYVCETCGAYSRSEAKTLAHEETCTGSK